MLVTIDFETYWDKDYTLSSKSMNTSEYIRDDRFQILVMAIKIDDQPTQCLSEINEIRDLLAAIDWTNADLLCHNTAFDGFILSTHFDVHPKMYYDTLSMARAVVGQHHKLDLNSLGEHLELGSKKEHGVLFSTKGKRELTDEELSTMCVYATQDVDLCYSIFSYLLPTYPQDELDLIDQTIRMFCEPVLQIDLPLVEEVLLEEVGGKAAALMAANSTGDILRSNHKFAEALEQLGVPVPMKQSLTTGFQTFAFAKNDIGFQNLLAHKDPRVRMLCEARLKLKSSIGETRANRFLEAGKDGATLPVMLNYYGAHTGRWSAGNKCLAGDTQIIVDRGGYILYIMLSELQAQDLVWDGEEFVTHRGLEYKGIQEVITHDNVTGTPDHEVFTDKGKIRLDTALSTLTPLRVGRLPGDMEPNS